MSLLPEGLGSTAVVREHPLPNGQDPAILPYKGSDTQDLETCEQNHRAKNHQAQKKRFRFTCLSIDNCLASSALSKSQTKSRMPNRRRLKTGFANGIATQMGKENKKTAL